MTTNKWVPLSKIAHGIAIAPFTPATTQHYSSTSTHSRPITVYSNLQSPTTDSSLLNANRLSTASSDISSTNASDYAFLTPLEVGDELYIFEQQGAWFRGYVLSSLEEGRKPNRAPNGIFPRSHVQIKEYVDMDPAENGLLLAGYTMIDGGDSGFEGLPVSPSPSCYSGNNIVSSPTFSDSMSRSPSGSQLGAHDTGAQLLPMLAPISNLSTVTTSTHSTAGHSRPTSGIDFDNNTDHQLHHRRIRSRSTTEGEQDHHQPKRPTPPSLPMVRFDQSTVTGIDEPLVDEIASCVSEWNCLLYIYLQESRYAAFNAVRDHINYLFQARRQLLDQALSREELSRLRKEIIQRMVTMNTSQHREMIIRHPERGFILDINSASAATLYYMHWKYTISEQVPITALFPQPFLPDDVSLKLTGGSAPTANQHGAPIDNASTRDQHQQQRQQARKKKTFDQYKGGEFHHLFFDLKACVAHICQPGEWTELRFSLYSNSQVKFVTEQFVVHLNYNGMPKDEHQIGKLQSLFVDLANQDLNEHLYLVCHIFRLGGMKFIDKEKDHLGSLGSHASSLFSGQNYQQHSQHSASGGGGYFDNSKRYQHQNNSHQQKSSYPNETASATSTDHTSLFRRPFGCAVLNIGRLLEQVDPLSGATHTKKGNGGTPTGQRSGSLYTDVDLMRSPTLPNVPQLSPTTSGMGGLLSPTSQGPTSDGLLAATTSSSGATSTASSGNGSGNTTGYYQIAHSEHDMRIYTPSSESTFAHLHEDIIQDNTKELANHPRAEMICVYLRMFYGQQDDVLKVNAAMLQDIPLTARIGFPDVVFPDDERNELYITLNSGDFAQFGRTRNIQVIICARDNYTGDVVEMAVSVGSGTSRTSTWESAIYYHEMKPTWNEMVKVKITDVNIWQRSHVFLVVKHRSRHGGGTGSLNNNPSSGGGSISTQAWARMTGEGNTSSSDKILAMGYLPLFIPPLSHDFVADGAHTLCLYKYDRQLLHPSSYFGVVPWCSQSTAPSNKQGQENMMAAMLQATRQRAVGQHHSNTSHASVKSVGGSSMKGVPIFSHAGSHHNLASSIGLQHSAYSSAAIDSNVTLPSYGSSGTSKPHMVRDSLTMSTFLCSTRFTQNTTLVQLINWRSMVEDSNGKSSNDGEGVDGLLILLDKFTFVGEQEVVKFLADIFDALLDILVYRVPDSLKKQNALHDQTIVAITWVLSIVQDRRFSNFRPVLNVYVNQRFFCSGDDDNDAGGSDDDIGGNVNKVDDSVNNSSPSGASTSQSQGGMNGNNKDSDVAQGTYQKYTSLRYRLKHNKYLRRKMTVDETTYNQLLKGLIRLATNPSDITKAKRLRSSIKVWEYLFRFIERSREMQRSNEDPGEHDLRELMYKDDLQQFFDLATQMLRSDQPSSMIGTQTLVLQHFCEAITEVKDAYSSKEIVDIISTLVDASSHVTGKLVGFKLSMILAIIKAPIFSDRACCCELGKRVIQWIRVWLNSYMAVAKEVIFSRTMDGGTNQQGGEDYHQQTRLPRAQWIENLRLSLTITHELLDKIRKVRGMSLPGFSSTMGSQLAKTMTATSSVSTTPHTRPTSMSTVGDEEYETAGSDNDDQLTGDDSLNVLTGTLAQLIPQLLQTYKDLQRLTSQAIQATSAPSGLTGNMASTSMNLKGANRDSATTGTRPNSRHSLTVLRERANSIRGLPQVLENAATGSNMMDLQISTNGGSGNYYSKAPSSGSFPVVLQALATSPTTPFPSVYPFQANGSNDAAQMAGSDLANMVVTGLMDLTVVLLDLFYLIPPIQWLHIQQNNRSNDIDSNSENNGLNATAEYLCSLCYVCMAILYGDDIQKLTEAHGAIEGYTAFMDDPTSGRRKWPTDWLNLDVVAHKIILVNILTPATALLHSDAFASKQDNQYTCADTGTGDGDVDADGDEDVVGAKKNTHGEDMIGRLWRTLLVTLIRVLASSSLDVETLLPQAQRAVWKLTGNIRGDEGIRVLKQLWDLTGPQSMQRTQLIIQQRQESKDLKMKPQLLAYFDNHGKSTVDAHRGETDVDDTLSDISSDDEQEMATDMGKDLTELLPMDGAPIQLELMPMLLKPLCSASLTLHDKLRSTTVGMIADLIAVHMRKTGDITAGQNLMIGTIDKLVMTYGKGSDEIRVKWVAELNQALQLRLTTETEQAWGRSVVDTLANLMELLLQIRSLPIDSAEFMDERINATLKLMKFIQVSERQEIYIKYVHQLVDLHLHNSNFVEAALTLRFHADLLQWDPYDELDAIPDLGYGVESSFARKRTLYETMIAYLDKGTAWELCAELCQELGDHYAMTVVDYQECSNILRQKASFLENIVKKERYYSEYFRVGFYGRGFPASIRNQHFIYRGMAWEKMTSFVERIQNRHPNAQVISGKMASSSHLPEDHIRELEAELDGQYMQITALTPMVNPQASHVLTNPLASEKVKKYYQFNNVSQFTYSRPVTREEENGADDFGAGEMDDSKDDIISASDTSTLMEPPILSKQELDFLHLWTERTTFTSEETFPGIALRSKILSIELQEISPIENAVEAMNNKTSELVVLEKSYSAYLKSSQTDVNLNPFSMALNGAVDAPVNGGVPLYKKAFLSPYYVKKHPSMRHLVEKLKIAIDEQVIVIDRCLDTHDQLVSAEMRPFHSNLVELYKKNFVDDITHLKRRGTAFKSAAATPIPKATESKDKSLTTGKNNKSPPNRLNLTTSASGTTGNQQNRRGSSLFRDIDRPLTTKSRTNSIASPFSTPGATSPPSTSHFSSLMSPKSASYFSIPTLREEQHSNTRSNGKPQTALDTSMTANSDRLQLNGNEPLSSSPTSPIRTNDQPSFIKSDGAGGLSKSLKMSIRKATRKTISPSVATQR